MTVQSLSHLLICSWGWVRLSPSVQRSLIGSLPWARMIDFNTGGIVSYSAIGSVGREGFLIATWPSLNPVSQVLSPRCFTVNQVFNLTFRTTQLLVCSESEKQHLMNPVLYLPCTEPGPSMHYGTIWGRYAVSRKIGTDEDTIHHIRYRVKGRRCIKINLQKMYIITYVGGLSTTSYAKILSQMISRQRLLISPRPVFF